MAARSEERAKAAIEDLKQMTGKEAIWIKLDLSSLKTVKTAADEFLEWVYNDSEWGISNQLSYQERSGTPYSIQ